MTFKGSCLHPCNGNDKHAIKRYEDNQEVVQLPDKSIESFNKIPYVCMYIFLCLNLKLNLKKFLYLLVNLIQLRSLTLSHNKIKCNFIKLLKSI